jgi:hypothetical protein
MILKFLSAICIILSIWFAIRLIIDWFIYKVLKHEKDNVRDYYTYGKGKKYLKK